MLAGGGELSYRVLLRVPPAPGPGPTEFTLQLNAAGAAQLSHFPYRSFLFNGTVINL